MSLLQIHALVQFVAVLVDPLFEVKAIGSVRLEWLRDPDCVDMTFGEIEGKQHGIVTTLSVEDMHLVTHYDELLNQICERLTVPSPFLTASYDYIARWLLAIEEKADQICPT